MSNRGSSSGSFSVLGADVTITGNISATTELHIDGTVEGDIDCASLVQGDGSKITGEVKAESARLAGKVDGSIHARELVILRSATINGDVHYEALTVEQGAAVQGRFAPREAAPAKPAASASTASTSNGATSASSGSASTASDLGASPFSSGSDSGSERAAASASNGSNYY